MAVLLQRNIIHCLKSLWEENKVEKKQGRQKHSYTYTYIHENKTHPYHLNCTLQNANFTSR